MTANRMTGMIARSSGVTTARWRLSDYGDVNLDSVELEELGDGEEIRQLARISIYTWELTNLPSKRTESQKLTRARYRRALSRKSVLSIRHQSVLASHCCGSTLLIPHHPFQE